MHEVPNEWLNTQWLDFITDERVSTEGKDQSKTTWKNLELSVSEEKLVWCDKSI